MAQVRTREFEPSAPMIHDARILRFPNRTLSPEIPVTAHCHSRSTPSPAARSVRMRCKVVRRMESPSLPEGKTASADNPEPRKRTPRRGHASAADSVTPSFSSAAIASGISASPQALSIGGFAPSATTTRNPCCRAAIAAANPAGPPPMTNTSVEFSNYTLSPLQKQKLGAKSRSHRGQQAQRARLRTPMLHHVLQHTQNGSRREISDFAQTIPGGV